MLLRFEGYSKCTIKLRQTQSRRPHFSTLFSVRKKIHFAALGTTWQLQGASARTPTAHTITRFRVDTGWRRLDNIGLCSISKDLKELDESASTVLTSDINDIELAPGLNPRPKTVYLSKYFYDETRSPYENVTKGRVRFH